MHRFSRFPGSCFTIPKASSCFGSGRISASGGKSPALRAGVEPFPIKAKDRLHLLFVVSRPKDAGFIDPRADPKAVIDALEEHAPGRVTYEFLRPATLNALVERLDDKSKPPVDILHFDGHGAFAEISEKDAEKAPELLWQIRSERDPAGTPVARGSVKR